MAYQVFIRPLNTDKSENRDTGGWFPHSGFQEHFPNKFEQVLFAGDYDYYGKFSKAELLKLAEDFAVRWELPETFLEYQEKVAADELIEHWMSKNHYELLSMLEEFEDDDLFHIDARFWESGMN